jgi:4-amino-4-deoxy-L-arabinose transferase-like glycosyltransferase
MAVPARCFDSHSSLRNGMPLAASPVSLPRLRRESLLLLLVVALVVRGAYAIGAWIVTRDSSVFLEQDTESYVAPARELLANGTFTVAGRPELERTPGYPLLLVIGLRFGELVPVTIAIQIVLAGLITVGVGVIACRLSGDERVGMMAGILYAFDPISIRETAALGTETLFTVFLVGGVALLVAYMRVGKLPILLAGVAIVSGASYVRPAGYYLAFGLLMFLGGVAITRRDWRRLAHYGLAVMVTIAVVLPWHVRNRALEFSGFSAISSVNMYFYNAAAVQARQAGASYAEMQAAMGYRDGRVYARLHPEQDTWSRGRRYAYMGAEGTRIVREHFAAYARLHVAGMLRVLLDPGALAILQQYGLYRANSGVLSVIVTNGLADGLRQIWRTNSLGFHLLAVLGIALVVVYGLALRGWLATGRVFDPSILLLVLTIAYFIIVAGGPVGVGRFRYPAMPFVYVLAAMGLVTLRRKRSADRIIASPNVA